MRGSRTDFGAIGAGCGCAMAMSDMAGRLERPALLGQRTRVNRLGVVLALRRALRSSLVLALTRCGMPRKGFS